MVVLGFDILYCIDIAMIFNTSYRNPEGEEIKDKVEIRDNYLKNHFMLFILDVLSLVGNYFFILISHNFFKPFEIFKVFRILRLINFLKQLKSLTKEHMSVVYIIRNIIGLTLILHSIACVWNWTI